MLIKRETLNGIQRGEVSLCFRRWKRPTVKAGGTLRTAIGQLAIDAVERVDEQSITDAEARAAGFTGRDELARQLSRRRDGDVYRIRVRLGGPDPRVALRAEVPAPEETRAIADRLDRMDARTKGGPWTRRTLQAIAQRPGVRAADLAGSLALERVDFKRKVRRLKELGLTESLQIGYRLSVRGEHVLRGLTDSRPDPSSD